MNDQPDKFIPITDPYLTPTVFVNQLVGSGMFHGVASFTFVTANWMPNAEGKFDVELAVTARLRMDPVCLLAMRDACDVLLAQAEKPEGKAH